MKINWQDVAISGVIIFMVLTLLLVLFPVKYVEQCTGTCPGGPDFTDCTCSISAIQPFLGYALVIWILPILCGFVYFFSRNKMTYKSLLVMGVLFLIIRILSYAFLSIAATLLFGGS